jgi:hypothetical protein
MSRGIGLDIAHLYGQEAAMVKIIQSPQAEGNSQTTRPNRQPEGDFRSVFQFAVTQGQGSSGPSPTPPVSEISPAASGSDLSRVELVVDMLSNYQELLADPQVPLKKAGPLVDNLDREADWLAMRAAQISGPAGLKDLLGRTAVTAKVEALKYQRGDYA